VRNTCSLHFSALSPKPKTSPLHARTHITNVENIFAELKPYPQEITWKDGISPKGVDYNQGV